MNKVLLDNDFGEDIQVEVTNFDDLDTYPLEHQVDNMFIFGAIQGLRNARETLTSASIGRDIISVKGICTYTFLFSTMQFWPLFMWLLSSKGTISAAYSFYVLPIMFTSIVLSPILVIYFLKTKNKKIHLRNLGYVEIVTLLFLLINCISFLLCGILCIPWLISQAIYVSENIWVMKEWFAHMRYY